MDKNVRDLFERYEKRFRTALSDQVDMDQVASSDPFNRGGYLNVTWAWCSCGSCRPS